MSKFKKHYKKLALSLIMVSAIFISSCTTQKHGYRPAKSKKKDCDCSKWSYHTVIQETKILA